MRAYRHETHKRIDFVVTFYVYTPIRSNKSKITFHLGKIDTHPEKKDTENTKEQKTTLCLCFWPLRSKKSQPLVMCLDATLTCSALLKWYDIKLPHNLRHNAVTVFHCQINHRRVNSKNLMHDFFR